ncbi:MAG: C40 family peptidase [Eubacteriales bacterium]|nr:C40 family peptidase [Eubacteriales bacterium]
MRNTMKKILTSLLLAAMIFNVAAVTSVSEVNASTATTATANSTTMTGRVSSRTLALREGKSKKTKQLKLLKKGKKITILESGKTWVKVRVGGIEGYVKGQYVQTSYGTASNPYANAIAGKASKKLTIRDGKSTSSTALGSITKNANVKVLTTNSKWVKVKVGDVIGYVIGKHIKTDNGTASNNSTKGQDLVAYARRFLGNPYVYGGSSLTRGTDCSGFVMALYRHFGYSLPHSSYALRGVGRAVSGGIRNARPGDIICYSGHVAIYMGNNSVIHASNPSSGIKITRNASYRHIVAIRRIFK